VAVAGGALLPGAGAMRAWPALPPPACGDRVLVVAPHPDDETIAAGGLIQRALSAGASVHVLLLTSGEARTGAARASGGPWRLAARRAAEARRAVAALGLSPGDLLLLGFPDRGLRSLWQGRPFVPATGATAVPYPDALAPGTPYTRQGLLGLLAGLMRTERPTWVVTPLPDDRHGDHAAATAFVRAALAAAGIRPLLLAYPVHVSGGPASLRGGPGWQALHLTPAEVRRKRTALAAYRSQGVAHLLRYARREERFYVLARPPGGAGRSCRPAPATR
jgi:LmbE family N-acetylglucosaminyl deacetylase